MIQLINCDLQNPPFFRGGILSQAGSLERQPKGIVVFGLRTGAVGLRITGTQINCE